MPLGSSCFRLSVQVALEMGHGPIIASIAAVVTGVFGGVLRDRFCNRSPLGMQKELYGGISFAAAWLYMGLLNISIPEYLTVMITLFAGFTARLLALRFRLGLPVFDYQQPDH